METFPFWKSISNKEIVTIPRMNVMLNLFLFKRILDKTNWL
jgi:hypothetical protein